MTMKRTTIVVAVLVGFVLGGITGGRLMSAEAQRRPAPVAPGDCAATLAERVQQLKRARQAREQSERIARAAMARADAAETRLEAALSELVDTRAKLELARRRLDELIRRIGIEVD